MPSHLKPTALPLTLAFTPPNAAPSAMNGIQLFHAMRTRTRAVLACAYRTLRKRRTVDRGLRKEVGRSCATYRIATDVAEF
jgi:hypothetical protein